MYCGTENEELCLEEVRQLLSLNFSLSSNGFYSKQKKFGTYCKYLSNFRSGASLDVTFGDLSVLNVLYWLIFIKTGQILYQSKISHSNFIL